MIQWNFCFFLLDADGVVEKPLLLLNYDLIAF